jgi:hypothetical protein
MWKDTVEPDRQTTDGKMVHAHCMLGIPTSTNTHSEYVTRIAFELQQWLHERPQCYVIRTLYVLIHTFAYSEHPVLPIAINISSQQVQDSESLSGNTHKWTTAVRAAVSRKSWQTVHKNCRQNSVIGKAWRATTCRAQRQTIADRKMGLGNRLRGCEVDRTGSGSCPQPCF